LARGVKAKGVKQVGPKKGLCLIPTKFLLEDRIGAVLFTKLNILHGARLFIKMLIKFLSYILP